jgi:N utilization substance protein A
MARKKSHDEVGPDSAGQSGDLQGISSTTGADSESVEELLEEGNTFEAEAVAGVERADDDEVSEVHTHQFPEDDVPREYLEDEDKL